MKMNWKIYIAAHKAVHDSMYENDPEFNTENYIILNVGSSVKMENEDKYSHLNQRSLNHYKELGKQWAESEGIYNIWRSKIYKSLDFVGFLHYDKELKLIKKDLFGRQRTNITERIQKYLQGKTRAHISFETHDIVKDYQQKILADITKPNVLAGDGLNCYDYILGDYNTFFQTNYLIDDLFEKKKINLCSCFLIDIAGFEKMMGFFNWVVLSGKLDSFDTEHENRLQGGLAERYFGVFLAFEYDECKDLSLIHHYNCGIK